MDFTALKNYLEDISKQWEIPSCSMTVRVGHETVFTHYVNAKPGDVYWIYSATKVSTAVMFSRMLERGILHLEDKVSDYLPEFANVQIGDRQGNNLRPATRDITLKNLITMCGGLGYNIWHPYIKEATDRTTRGIMREIARIPLFAEPGEAFMYSLCHDVLAGVMEVVSGTRYMDLLRKEVLDPLGMKDTTFQPDDALSARFVPQYKWDEEQQKPVPFESTCRFRFSDVYDSGGAGLCSTMEDYILLADALANGGTAANGYQLLKPETIDEMRRDQLSPSEYEAFKRGWARLNGYSYGLGVRTRINHDDGGKSPIGEFGWDGAAGCYLLADPENKISAYYIQHVNDMGPIYHIAHLKMRDLIYECLEA